MRLIINQNKSLLYFLVISVSAVFGILLVAWQQELLSISALIIAIAAFFSYTKDFSIRVKILFLVLFGFVIFNYGFANFALPIGIPLPVGHLLCLFLLLGLLFIGIKDLKGMFSEPIIKYWFALVVITILHLIVDIPRYGIYAFRDALFIFEGSLMFIGILWAIKDNNFRTFFKILAVIFIINLMYSFTFPFMREIQALSPKSGIFRQIPLLGTYSHNYLYLLLGAVFFFLFGERVLKIPKWLNLALIISQFGGLLILQARSMYVAVLVVFFLLYKYGKSTQAIRLVLWIGISAFIITSVISNMGFDIQGRMGDISIEFLLSHIDTIIPSDNASDREGLNWRLKLMNEVIDKLFKDFFSLIWGVGFGEVLITFFDRSGTAVRQPHNTHLSVLARLGIIGLTVWVIMYAKLFFKIIRNMRSRSVSSLYRDVSLWFLIYLITGLLLTSVQPWLEFSYGAIPFFIILGYSIGMENNLKQKRSDLSPE